MTEFQSRQKRAHSVLVPALTFLLTILENVNKYHDQSRGIWMRGPRVFSLKAQSCLQYLDSDFEMNTELET